MIARACKRVALACAVVALAPFVVTACAVVAGIACGVLALGFLVGSTTLTYGGRRIL